MNKFYLLLSNSLLATTTNNFLWFCLVFWVYLETRSVIASSMVGATFPLFSSMFGIVFGTYVDHHKKKSAMLLSSVLSLILFSGAAVIYWLFDPSQLLNLRHPAFWLFVTLIMAGALVANLRMIAISTLVTMLVPKDRHDKANGLVGMVNGVSFAITSVFSGLAIAYLGMGWSLILTVVITLIAIGHLVTIHFKDSDHLETDEPVKKADFVGAWKATMAVPGLLGLIFFTMINNFLGGAFFSLMDPYGLELVSVQTWGIIWGGLSFTFILGGMLVAKFGLGEHPLRRLFMANICMWIVGILFPLQASIIFVMIGMCSYMILVPMVEAAEQTILQKVVPLKKQGRVFGFAQTLETLASPIMALAIGPLTQVFFIPLMTNGRGAELIGSWFGTGVNRGIGLVFIMVSFIGLIITLIATQSKPYRLLSNYYAK